MFLARLEEVHTVLGVNSATNKPDTRKQYELHSAGWSNTPSRMIAAHASTDPALIY